jgi:hypothetical protein
MLLPQKWKMSIFPFQGEYPKQQKTSEKQVKQAWPATGQHHQRFPVNGSAFGHGSQY